ncbi:hypothetical protein ACIRVK_41060 [Streptomyces sp. NPDC101152]|uniref:hypothetical protein n=1 Tax=Streptomyces sp. NPDC101152 TaxID=3366116 RepID=UPI0038193B37
MPILRTRRTALPAMAVVGALLSGCGAGADTATEPLKHPCTLLTPAEGKAVLRQSPGTGKEIVNGDVSECAYQEAELYVAVAHAPYTRKSFLDVVHRTRSKSAAVREAGLGDAAYSFREVGHQLALFDMLKGDRLVQISSPTVATSRQTAQAVLRRLP